MEALEEKEQEDSVEVQQDTVEEGADKKEEKEETNKHEVTTHKLTMLDENGEEIEVVDLPPIEYENRKCTDVLCLLLLFAFILVEIGLAGFSYANGDPLLLLYGTDNKGNLCGTGDFEDRRFLALPRLTEDIAEADVSDITGISFFGVCQESCPKENDFVCTDDAEAAILTTASGLNREELISNCLANGVTCDVDIVRDECFLTVFNTTGFLFRCLPEFVFIVETIEEESGCVLETTFVDDNGQTQTRCARFRTVEQITTEEPPDSNIVADAFNTIGRRIEQTASDILQTVDVVAGVGLGYSLLASLLYVGLLWLVVGPVVWASVGLIILSAIAFTTYLYIKAGVLTAAVIEDFVSDVQSELLDISGQNTAANLSEIDIDEVFVNLPSVSTDFQREYEIAAQVSTAFSAILILLILCSIPKISRAIKFFKEASHTLRANFGLLCFPPCVAILVLANGVFFLASLAFSQTVGDIEINELNFSFSGNEVLTSSEFVSVSYSQFMAVYFFFGYLWLTQVIVGTSTMMISHVITQSYWNTEPGKLFYKSGSIRRAVVEVLRFHVGTVAFGALLIAIVQLIRAIATYVDQRTKNIQEKNKLVKYFMKAVHCCLWCAEKCMKYASNNAFIITGMYGTSFCTSSLRSFFAILANLRQVALVQFFGEIIVRFGQILVTLTSGIIAVSLLDTDLDSVNSLGDPVELVSVIPPLLLILILSWVIASGVLNIYAVAVDTLMLSYILDKKRLKDRGQEYKAKRASQAAEGNKMSLHNLMVNAEDAEDKMDSI